MRARKHSQTPECQISASMAFANTFYNALVKRNSVYVSTIFLGAFGFGIGLDLGVSTFWDRWNRGKQWKDIRDKYASEE